MKKIISGICLLFLYASIVLGQSTTMTIGTVPGGNVNDTISVPLNVSSFVNVGAISLKMSYDPAVLSYVSVSDSKFTANAVNGVLAISWYDATSTNPINLSSGTLLNIKFVYKGGSSSLNFVTSVCEIANKTGDVIPTAFVNGRVGNVPSLSFGSASVSGTTYSIPVNVTNFQNIGAVSLKIKYDPAVLTYKDYANAPSSNFTINASNGVMTIGWFDTAPMNMASGKFVTLNFTYTGGQSALTFDTPSCEVSNSTGDPMLVNYSNGVVGSVPKLTLGTAVISETTASVPLNVTGFKGVGAVSLKIKYDPAVVTYVDATNTPSSNFTANASNGVLTIGWFDTTPYSADSAKFAALNFTYNGGQSALTFDKANCEISNASGLPLNAEYVDGLIGQAPVLTLGPSTISGSVASLPVNVKNFKNIGAVSLKIKYDPAVMSFKDVSGAPANNFTVNAANGVLTIGWFDTNPLTIDNGKFVTINFNYIGGSSQVVFDKTNCEISTANGNPVAADYVNGVVGVSPQFFFGPAVISGTTATVPLNIKALKNIGAVSLKIKYSPAVLAYTGASNTPANNFTSNASNGVLTIGWFDTTPMTVDSGKFAALNFTYSGGRSELAFDLANCEISTADGTPIMANFTNGSVGQTPVISVSRIAGVPSKSLSVPVNIKNFKGIGAVSVKMNYDLNSLEYKGYTGAPANNFAINVTNGQISLGWFDTNAMNVDNGTFVTLNFVYNGGNSNITFNSAQSEIASAEGQIVTAEYINGSVEEDLTPAFTSSLKDTTVKENVKFTFNYKADDPNKIEVMKYSLIDKPAGAVIDSLTGVFTWTPDYTAANTNGGKYKVTVAVKKTNFTVTTSANITVTDVNRAPAFSAVPKDTVMYLSAASHLPYYAKYQFTYKAADPDNDAVKYYLTAGPSGAKIDSTTGAFEYTLAKDALYNGNIIVTVKDGKDGITADTMKFQVTVMTGVVAESGVPSEFSLKQNFPNPFNPTTNIKYALPKESRVSLKVYNLIGQEVKVLVNQVQPAGNYIVDFNAANLPSGMYIYRLDAGSFNQTRKMTLLK